MGKTATLQSQDEEDDEYYEVNDDRPSMESQPRPTDERGERPMRSPTSTRWGPRRGKSR